MNKELQDLAWSILPKEFKEEVKEYYNNSTVLGAKAVLLLENLFGEHNLTSDAEGEEMLTVSRKRVQEMYAYNEDILSLDPTHSGAILLKKELQDLFGSKCLPDEEPKPAEPKFKVGDKVFYVCSITVKHKCTVTKVMQNEHSGKWEYNVLFDYGKPGLYISESDLEPYTEPEKESRNLSKNIANCDKQFDNILKDGFRNERRLNIAAMVMQGLLSNPTAMNGPKLIDGDEEIAAMWSLKFADALIAKCEKGGNNATD